MDSLAPFVTPANLATAFVVMNFAAFHGGTIGRNIIPVAPAQAGA